MTNHPSENSKALEHVDPARRGFLTKMLAGGVALPVISSIALGATPQVGQGKGGGGKGKGGGGKGKGGGGKGKGNGQGQGGANGNNRDAAEMAKRMIAQFDKDGDRALNVQELALALTAMRQRRGNMGEGKGSQAGQNGAGKGKGKGKGKGAGGNQEPGGGIIPKKPGN